MGEALKGGRIGGTGDVREERVRRCKLAAVAAAGVEDRSGPEECRCGLADECLVAGRCRPVGVAVAWGELDVRMLDLLLLFLLRDDVEELRVGERTLRSDR